jgi:acetate kinase
VTAASAPASSILTVNTGSSSLKAALYEMGPAEVRRLSMVVDGIGQHQGRMRAVGSDGTVVLDRVGDVPDHDAALTELLDWFTGQTPVGSVDAIGHRVVHGGPHFHAPQPITPALLAALEQLTAIDPDHLPQALRAIRRLSQRFPTTPQIACFDTAFHRTMPPVAQRYPLPQPFVADGLVRYGFHGLSYEFIVGALRRLDPVAAAGRVIVAHLGNGASMVAMRNGMSLDTTMGFTPTGGLVMSTRTGDLDPSVPLFLQRAYELSSDDVVSVLNKQAGLLGVSETTADMRELLERATTDARATAAIELFCYQAKKFLGALAAVLGGLDTLVFTAGIGEHAPPIRARICADLVFLGIQLDAERNAANAAIISADDSQVTVRVIPTDEDLMIARHTVRLLAKGGSDVHL